jgi:hypothetical protein
VEEVVGTLLAPLRFVAHLGAPFAVLDGGRVEAAERELAENGQLEASEGAAALSRLAERALPRDSSLQAGRRFVPGEVVGRASKDRCWVAVADADGIVPAAPVVCGDAFVGRVLALGSTAADGRAWVEVELVTAGDFRIGAEVARGEERVFLTVGGLAPRRPGERRTVRLAVHQPSDPTLAEGVARVHELFPDAQPCSELAAGFRLGGVRSAGERGPWWLEPELDFLDGLYQVAIVVDGARGVGASSPFAPALEDGRWVATRVLAALEPAGWRSTLRLPVGSSSGVQRGAAVTGVGARLIGRIDRAERATSSVALLTDPGCTLVALALVEGSDEPHVLGRLTSLGRAPGGLRLKWTARVPLEFAGESDPPSAEPLSARLFTGSGEPGLPGGLFLGATRLPRRVAAGEEHELLLELTIDPADLRSVFVRRETAEEAP